MKNLDLELEKLTEELFNDLVTDSHDKLNIEELYEAVIEESFNEDPKWMEHAIHKKGAFTEYCKKGGFKGVTKECIEKGLKSKDPLIKKRANLARVFLRKKLNLK